MKKSLTRDTFALCNGVNIRPIIAWLLTFMLCWWSANADAYGTIKSRWEISETLQLNDDSTFIWKLNGLQGDFRSGYQSFVKGQYGGGIYSRRGDTIILNSKKEDMPIVKVRYLKQKKHNKNSKRVRFVDFDKRFYQISYVLYVNEYGDTILKSNLMLPELGVMAAGCRETIELGQLREIIDVFIEPIGLRLKNLYEINEHNGDIEIKISQDDEFKRRYFFNEKWTVHGDTIFPLIKDESPSLYPLIKKNNVYESKREFMGKQYNEEYDSIRIFNSYYNYKYYSQPITNKFKRYGLITEVKAYDADGNLVAEGEYLSDTNNPFLIWYRYIKVGRWEYYEPDGTIRYVDY